jgi:hypothetical protein
MHRRSVAACLVALALCVPSGELRAAAQDRQTSPPLDVSIVLSPALDRDGKPTIAAIVSVDAGPSDDESRPRTRKIELQAEAFAEGAEKPAASQKLSLSVPLPAGESVCEIFSRLPVAPGAYDVRVTVKADTRTGQAAGHIDVPDPAGERLSSTALMFHAEPSPPSGPPDGFADLLGLAPTARRTFSSGDHLVAFARLHAGGTEAIEPVRVTARLVNAAGQGIASEFGRVDRADFDRARNAGYRFAIPVDRLAPGEYALSVGFAMGGAGIHRDVRFQVR